MRNLKNGANRLNSCFTWKEGFLQPTQFNIKIRNINIFPNNVYPLIEMHDIASLVVFETIYYIFVLVGLLSYIINQSLYVIRMV